MSKIMISELEEATAVQDSDYIALDDGTATKKITVENYNDTANHTAKSYAEQAGTYADNAHTSELAAKAAKNEAEVQVSAAATQVGYAETHANAASASATAASTSASVASTKAANAENSATAAAASAAEVENEAKMAESWAVGNTGVRPGENTNNAKYWANVAQGSAGGGVTTFNGRSGAVVPIAGDYDSTQIIHNDGTQNIPLSDEIADMHQEIADATYDVSQFNAKIDKVRDGILQGTQNKTTVYNGNIVTDTYADGHRCVTTYNGNTITEQMYDGNNVLMWTKTTTYNGNQVQEVYS